MCKECGCDTLSHEEMHLKGMAHKHPIDRIAIERNLLEDNDNTAMYNRGYCAARRWVMINMVSSPGAGKTTLLEKSIERLKESVAFYVIEGDQQTDNDARRIARTGVDAVQINTENGCHLNAAMIRPLLEEATLSQGGIVLVENVGNLVCPALFDLGENCRVVVLSVTEGDDKPLKYPYIFTHADVCIINKTDLLPYVPCDMETLRSNIRSVNPDAKILELSALDGTGLDTWCHYLKHLSEEII